MKIRPVGAKMFQAYRQTEEWTDMTKIIIAFCNFANTLEVTKSQKALQNHLKLTHKKHPHSCDFRLGKRRSHKGINEVNRKGGRSKPCF
jgi:hypothetical protein